MHFGIWRSNYWQSSKYGSQLLCHLMQHATTEAEILQSMTTGIKHLSQKVILLNTNFFNGPLSRTTRVSWYQKNVQTLTPHLCAYYTISLINFLHLLWFIASSLFSCQVRQSFFTTSLQVFFGLLLDLTPSTS